MAMPLLPVLLCGPQRPTFSTDEGKPICICVRACVCLVGLSRLADGLPLFNRGMPSVCFGAAAVGTAGMLFWPWRSQARCQLSCGQRMTSPLMLDSSMPGRDQWPTVVRGSQWVHRYPPRS